MLQAKNWIWKTHATGRLIQVRFVPRGSTYVMEIVTEVEVPDIPKAISSRIASIDLGVNNLVALTNNIGERPIIINGKGVKSINRYYNKQRAKSQSDLMLRNKQHWSKALEVLTRKRFNRIKNFMHNTSRYIVNWCVKYNIDTIVIGKNDGWKQNVNLCKSANQNFVGIPCEMLIQQIQYKAEEQGIKVILTEESYTSGSSFLDGEIPCKENYNYSRRIKRGLFQASTTLINSDVNGSLQIMKKVFPNSFGYGIEGDLTPLVINIIKI